jgi:hypothetical protein
MKSSRSKTVLAILAAGVVSCALFSQQAQAVPITGQIDFAGGITLDNAIGSATAISSVFGVSVMNALPTDTTGSYAGLGGATVPTFNGFTFAPFSVPGNPLLWSFTTAGITYSFNITNVTGVTQIAASGGTPGSFNLSGTGVAMITGFADTVGTFSVSSHTGKGGGTTAFTFAAGEGVPSVPDDGSTVALLGIALAGIEAVRRKIFARNA